jgi:hypothetical protein
MDVLQFLRRVIVLVDGDVTGERPEGVVTAFNAVLAAPLEP